MSWLVGAPFAHRGLHSGKCVPENTIAAFDAAIQRGYPIEMDVHLLSSGEWIVFHDDDLKRLTGSSVQTSEIAFTNLKTIKILESDQGIPTLEEVLFHVNGRVPLLIEVKGAGHPDKLSSALCNMVDRYRGDFAVQSFDPYFLRSLRKRSPAILRGQLSGVLMHSKTSQISRFLLRRLFSNILSQPNFISYESSGLPNAWVKIHRNLFNVPILAWTVRNAAERRRVSGYCDNIIFEGFTP